MEWIFWTPWQRRYPSFDHFRAAVLVDIAQDLAWEETHARQRRARQQRVISPVDQQATWPIPKLAEAIARASATTEVEIAFYPTEKQQRGQYGRKRDETRRKGRKRHKTQKLSGY